MPINPGIDSSGNGNNWTAVNIEWVTSGANYDIMRDSPVNFGTDTGVGGEVQGNYATWNPLVTSTAAPVTFSNGNLDVSFGSSLVGWAQSTIGVSSGKWYAEVTVTASSTIDRIIGIATPNTNNQPGYTADSYGYYGNGQKVNNLSFSAYGSSYTTNDVIGIALDLDAGTLTFYKNNVSQGQAFSGLSGTYFISVSDAGNAATCSYTANFGQRPFAYTAPSGFKALCTENLPTPTIADGGNYFNTVLYTGNGSTQSITGVGFQPDWVWFKRRSASASHVLVDVLRGNTKNLFSNLTDAEQTQTEYLTSFNADGFSLGDNNPIGTGDNNVSGATYVAWNWKANGAGVSNTAGTITSTVSANTTAGFSIVTFTAPATNQSFTVGHGLGIKPSMVLKKRRNSSVGGNWWSWHIGLGDNTSDYIDLDSTAAEQSLANMWGTVGRDTTLLGFNAPNSCVAGETSVAYVFAPVAGYSAFGSYTGNGSADGPFVYTGFRVSWLLLKETTPNARNWMIFDAARSPYNQVGLHIMPNSSDAEGTGSGIYNQLDFLSNGVKFRAGTNSEPTNESGATYIYAAFAENPFKIARAR